MPKKQVLAVFFFGLLVSLVSVLPAHAHGDSVVPQVADGAGVIRTKFDFTNMSPVERISKIKLLFFRQDGSAWSVPTNQGTNSEFTLSLGRFQTLRIETLGTTSTLTSGYAIIRNTEATTIFDEDFEVATTVYYEILSGSNVVDTVSVPMGQPALSFVIPVEIDSSKNLFTGFAIVNLVNLNNNVQLKLWKASTPSSADATDDGTVNFTLNPNEQRARYLNESGFFPTKTTFKGMLLGFSSKPVAILGLLQTSTPGGLQYATLVPAYEDNLRKDTYMHLRQEFPLDADIPISDYFNNADDDFPWDLVYESQSNTSRRLVPQNGALVSVVGTQSETQFDNISLEQLQARTYDANNIDLSDGSSNLVRGFAFAIKTALGRYVKVRVAEVYSLDRVRSDGTTRVNKDLALEIFVYR
jgi:hypothetical protein